jgi:serine/threonine protein kinase
MSCSLNLVTSFSVCLGNGCVRQVGQVIKNYKLGEVLGKGSNGTVYKSLNMDTGDVVAIKQVPLHNIPKEDLAGP